MRKLPLALLLFLMGGLLWGQSNADVRVTGFVPGNYRFDDYHRVEISNISTREVSLAGWILVTRDYSVVLPNAARIPAGSKLVLVKRAAPPVAPGTLELSKQPDFLIRFPNRQFEGNYTVLYNRDKNIVDAFLYAPLREVPYLPDQDTSVTFKGEKTPFYLPAERNGVWQFLQGRDDPAIAFERGPEGWRIVSRRKLGDPAPVFEYTNFTLRYQDGIVTLRWSYQGGLPAAGAQHQVERSEDQVNFVPVGTVEMKPDRAETSYEFFDPQVVEGKTYFYRVVATKGRQQTQSEVKSITAAVGQEDLSMEVFLGSPPRQREINIRFYSGYSQKVRIKVMDSQFREVAVVFDGFVNAQTRSLVKLREELPPGVYRVFAQTETRRYAREVVVK
jgi:hypothetical protein